LYAPPRKNCAPAGSYKLGDSECLFAALYGTGPGDHRQVASANRCVCSSKANDGIFFLHIAAGELVRLADADHVGHAGKIFKVAAVDFAGVAGDTDGSALRARQRMGAKSHLFDVIADRLYLFLRSLRFHDD
jgi:hypothetical protein